MTSKSFAAPDSAPPPKAALSVSANHPTRHPERARDPSSSRYVSFSSTTHSLLRRVFRLRPTGPAFSSVCPRAAFARVGSPFGVRRLGAAFAFALTTHSTELRLPLTHLCVWGPSRVLFLLCLCRDGFTSPSEALSSDPSVARRSSICRERIIVRAPSVHGDRRRPKKP